MAAVERGGKGEAEGVERMHKHCETQYHSGYHKIQPAGVRLLEEEEEGNAIELVLAVEVV